MSPEAGPSRLAAHDQSGHCSAVEAGIRSGPFTSHHSPGSVAYPKISSAQMPGPAYTPVRSGAGRLCVLPKLYPAAQVTVRPPG